MIDNSKNGNNNSKNGSFRLPEQSDASSTLARYTVSMDARLLSLFDQFISRRGYNNRSEAIRDLIRVALIDEQWTNHPESDMVATVTLVYDHHGNIAERLSELQHEYCKVVLSTTHIHLDPVHCLEVVILRGKAEEIIHLVDALVTVRGVKHGKAVYSSDGKNLY